MKTKRNRFEGWVREAKLFVGPDVLSGFERLATAQIEYDFETIEELRQQHEEQRNAPNFLLEYVIIPGNLAQQNLLSAQSHKDTVKIKIDLADGYEARFDARVLSIVTKEKIVTAELRIKSWIDIKYPDGTDNSLAGNILKKSQKEYGKYI